MTVLWASADKYLSGMLTADLWCLPLGFATGNRDELFEKVKGKAQNI